MSLLLLFPDHSLFPAEGPAGAEAACCAPCEMPSAGTEEALRALPECWGSRARLCGAGEGSGLQHQGQRAGSRERRGRGRRVTAQVPLLKQRRGVKTPEAAGTGWDRAAGRDSAGGTRNSRPAPQPAGLCHPSHSTAHSSGTLSPGSPEMC